MLKLSLESIEHPMTENRGMPFWSWNTKLERETLIKQIHYFKEMGFGGFYMHPRVGLDTRYLGNEYMEAIKISVDEAKRLDLHACLYDEDRWPSGYGGGIVTKNPEFRANHLLLTIESYEESEGVYDLDYNANFASGIRTNKGELLAVYDVLLDHEGFLKSYRQIGRDEQVVGCKWYAYIEENPPHSWYNGGAYVDVLNPDAIDSFIQNVYQLYKEKVGDEFGKTISSIFTDEPHMIYKTNLQTPNDKNDQYMPWTNLLPKELKQRYGVDILANLPEIFWNTKEESITRYYFHRILAELFEEAYTQKIGKWCNENNIDFTGHFLYEETLFLQNRSSGNLMSMYRNMSIPGMDLLFDDIALTTAKQVQSVVHQYGKKGAMSEEYGGTNWGFDFRDYFFQGNWQAALGINTRVPHLSYMSMKGEGKRDFPASIFYQAPWYREFKEIENHFARINYIMNQGEANVRIGVIHPLESYWCNFGPQSQTQHLREERDNQFVALAHWLLESNLDFDYLEEALMDELFDGRGFGEMNYDVIVLPDLKVIRPTTLSILTAYNKNGGNLLVFGDFPKVLDIKEQENCFALERTLRKKAIQVPFKKLSILKSLADYQIVSIEDEPGKNTRKYIYQLKECEDYKQLFITPLKRVEKENRDGKEVKIKIKGQFTPYYVNTKDGNINQLESELELDSTIIKKTMYEGETVLLLLKKDRKQREKFVLKNTTNWHPFRVGNNVNYAMEEPNVLLLDIPEYSLDDEEYAEREEILKIDEILRRRLGFKDRNSSMEQPYQREDRKSEHVVSLKYTISSLIKCDEVSVALEEINNTQIYWNGKRVIEESEGWYVDEDFKKVVVGKLLKGSNTLELKIAYQERTNLEAAYLLGNFGVEVLGAEARIVPYPLYLAWGGIERQAFGFYGGNVFYKFKVNCPGGKLKVEVPKYRGALIGIEIDNVRSGSIVGSPYIFEVEGLKKGEHEVVLILFGNRYNTFSHLHYLDDEKDRLSSPSLWRNKDNKWCYEYNIKPMGIMTEPKIYV